ncbi:unnamed protein product [Phytophthora lilii]|uniref:Centrosomal protein of 162 kDa n=1 Tax=Phytophthora lilii TaxID=2077276 RepID=A0A9W6TFQ6_9STRA|nr:unnamed protein product [Phytophthora lilii]
MLVVSNFASVTIQNTETMQDGVGESSADYADEGFEADTGVQSDAQDSSPSPEPLVAENTQLITQSFGDHTVDRNAKVEALLAPKYGDFYSLEDDGKADEDIVRDETQKPKLSQEPMPPLVDVAKEVSTTAPASVFEIHASQHESPPSSPPPPPPPDDDEEDDHELHRFVLDAPVKGTDFETETPTAQHPATAVRVSPLSAGDRFRKIENQVATLRFVNPLGTPNMVAVNSPASEAVHPVSAKSLTNRQDDAAPPYMEPMSISFDAGLLAEDEETQREIDDFLRSSQVLRQEHRAAARRASLARENELVLRLQQAQRHIIQLKEHIQATASDPRQLGGGAVPKPSDAQSNHDEEHTKSTGANDSTSNIPHSAFKKLEKEIKTQDNLIAAFQKENERLMQQLKQVRQDVQYDVHEANEELRQQIRKLQDQIGEAASLGSGGGDLTSKAQYRVAVEARLEAEAHALALQEELAGVRLSYQQKLNEVTLELDRVKKTKVELECRYEGVDLAQVAQETQHARDLQSELDLCKKEHAHALSALQKKLDWYVENQRLLDDQDEELRKLRRLVAEKPSDAATVMPSKGQMKHSQLGGPSPARPHRRSPNDIRRIQELEGRLSEMEEAMRRRHPDSLSNLILASRRAEDESKTRALEHDYQEKLAALSRELEQAHEASETKLASFRQQQEKLLLQYRRKIKEQEKLLKQFSKAPLAHRTMTKDATGTNATPDAELAKVRRFYTDKIKELERKWETKYRSLRKQQYSGLGSSQQTQEGLTYADSAVVIANLQRQIREQELELKQEKAKVEQLEAESQLTEARPEDSPTAIDVKSNLKQQIKLKKLEEQVADLTAQLQDSESARAQLAQTLTTVQTLGLARSLNANVPQTTTLTESVPTIETTPPQQNDAELAQLRQEMYDTREALRTERANSLEKIATLEKQITAHAEQNALLKSQLTNSQREMQSLQTLALKAERHNRALEAQARRVPELEEEVLSLQRELELPRTPSMVQYRSLELKVATLEQKHKLREAELKVVLDRALTSTHLEQLSRERAHRAAMAAKNAEIATFKSQLEEILDELAQLQRAPSSRRPADGGDDATSTIKFASDSPRVLLSAPKLPVHLGLGFNGSLVLPASRRCAALGHGVDEGAAHAGGDGRRLRVLELEDALHHRDLGGRGVKAAEGRPVVHHEAGADDVATAVHGAGHHGHLQQRTELLLVLDAGARVHEAALVGQRAVAAHERVARHGLAEDLDAERVGHDLLGLAVQVRVHERHVVVGGDAVAQRRESLLHALHRDGVGQRVADVLHLLVRGGAGQQQPALVAHGHAAHEAAAGDAGVHHGDVVGQLRLERAVEVLGAAHAHQAVRVGELGEDADLVAVLELAADRHGCNLEGKRAGKETEVARELRIRKWAELLATKATNFRLNQFALSADIVVGFANRVGVSKGAVTGGQGETITCAVKTFILKKATCDASDP